MFTGFTPETIDFLWGIRMNNNRDWFLEHKKQYVDTLYEPMKELGKELFQPFLDKPGNILKVSRIYRDQRMQPAEPYKESLWICIRQDVDWWGENPCLFLEVNPEGVSMGFFIWKPRPATMKQFRAYISAKPRELLDLIKRTEEVTGLPIQAACYKHPAPCENPELERFYLWKSQIGCTIDLEPGEDMFGPQLKDKAADLFAKLTPLYEYFNQFKV